MAVWRMAFRVGPGGYDMWPKCQSLGIAAYRADPFRDVDLSQYPCGEPGRLWRQLNTTAKSSFWNLVYEVKKWDTIYVKQGTKIVGRGTVTHPYPYRFGDTALLVDNEGFPWRHRVRVSWEPLFEPIDIKLQSEETAVLRLSGDRLRRLHRALSRKPEFTRMRVRDDTESLEQEEQPFKEGGRKKRYTNYFERDPNLRAAAIEHHGTRCMVCRFDFGKSYGEHGLGFIEVHHLRPVSTLGKNTEVDPGRDMAVVCPNCHRMIHRTRQRVLTVDELKEMIATRDK